MKKRKWIPAALALSLLLVMACNVFTSTASNSPPPTLTAVPPLVSAGSPVPFSGERITPDNVSRVALLTRLGKGAASQVRWSPDGRTLALSNPFGIYLLDASTLKQIGFVEEPVWISRFDFSPDGSLLAVWQTGTYYSNGWQRDYGVRVHRVSDGSLLRELDNETSVGSAAFSPDSTLLATSSSKNSVRLWRTSDWTMAREFTPRLPNDGNSLSEIVFSPDWSMLAAVSASPPPGGSNRIRLWQVSDGSFVRELKELGYTRETDYTFSPDGTLLVSRPDAGSSYANTPVRLRRVSDGSLVRELSEPPLTLGYSFSPDGSLLTTTSDALRVLRVSDGSVVHEMKATSTMSSASFSPDGSLLASVDDSGLRVWRVDDGSLVREQRDWHRINHAALSRDGSMLESSGWDGVTELWRVSDGSIIREIKGESWVGPSSLSPDGALMATRSDEGTVRLRRVSDGSLVREFKVRLPEETDLMTFDVLLSPDWSVAVSLSRGGTRPWPATMRFWQVSDGSQLRTVSGPALGGTYSITSFSPDGSLLGSITSGAARASGIRLWRVGDGSVARDIEEDYLTTVRFNPDGALMVGLGGNRVRVRRVSDGSLVRQLDVQAGNVYGVAFSPDGQVMATGSDDDSVRLWRVSDWTLLRELKAHRGPVENMMFSPSGDFLISTSQDGTLGLWGIPSTR